MGPKALDGRRVDRISKHTRVRSGCLICRQRRKKCDETRPRCQKCQRMELDCHWPRDFTFRNSGPGIDEVTGEPMEQLDRDIRTAKPGSAISRVAVSEQTSPPSLGDSQLAQQQDQLSQSRDPETVAAAVSDANCQLFRLAPSPLAVTDDFSDLGDGATDWLLQMSDGWSWSPLEPMESHGPDTMQTYYPNAEYRALHATLYNYMVDTARAENTRQGTPVSLNQSPDLFPEPQAFAGHVAAKSSSSTAVLTAQRERELWANYVDEVTDWLDMFDNDNHFKTVLPTLAQKAKHLRLAILALSSRQLERKDPNKPYVESLGLYSEAIQLINDDLASMGTAVIASCVLLCVLEMMSSSPNEWARHLDGCAMLLTAAGIHGAVGGMKQAIFWCFARME